MLSSFADKGEKMLKSAFTYTVIGFHPNCDGTCSHCELTVPLDRCQVRTF